MENVIQKLNKVSEEWKAQFREPYDKHWTPKHFGTPPELPLRWTVDPSGMLFLDDVWICPVTRIDITAFDDAMKGVNPVSFDLMLFDGILTVVIVKDYEEYRIVGVERSVAAHSCLVEEGVSDGSM